MEKSVSFVVVGVNRFPYQSYEGLCIVAYILRAHDQNGFDWLITSMFFVHASLLGDSLNTKHIIAVLFLLVSVANGLHILQ